MYSLKKFIAILLITVIVTPTSSVMALDVQSAVISLQTTDVSLPAVANPKGNIGFILANIFGSSGNSLGKIQAQYLDYSGISAWTQSGSQTWLTTTTGSVGIGTTNPWELLDLYSDIRAILRISGPSTINKSLYLTDTTNDRRWSITQDTSNKYGISYYNGSSWLSTRPFTIDTSGSVGIGTISPVASLEVKRSTADGQFAAWIEGTNTANFGIGVNIANTGSTVAVADFRAGNTSRLYIRGDGNVGIGTTAPGAKLSFNNMNDNTNGADGITWYNPSPSSYGIYRTAGTWTAPDYQQLKLNWDTGIIINGGTAYGKSGLSLQPNGGPVTVGADPTSNLGVATKQYVDAAVGAAGGGLNVYKDDGVTVVGKYLGIMPYADYNLTNICDRLIYSPPTTNLITNMGVLNCESTNSNGGTTYWSVDMYFTTSNCTGYAYAKNIGWSNSNPIKSYNKLYSGASGSCYNGDYLSYRRNSDGVCVTATVASYTKSVNGTCYIGADITYPSAPVDRTCWAGKCQVK